MPTIDVPSVGPVDFPEGMSDGEMKTAIEKNYGPQMRAARNPEDVTAGMALRGAPGGRYLIPRAEAAMRAARGLGEGGSFAERYANLVPEREAQYAQAEKESPIASGALQVAGGTAALAPLGATALGGKVLGMTGGPASRALLGSASSAALAGGDAALSGDDPSTAAMIGGGIGLAAGPIASAISRVISPLGKINPERAAAAASLESKGIPVTAGQKAGPGHPIYWGEAALGDVSGARKPVLENQAKAYTREAAAPAGIRSDELTPDTLNNAFEAWGKQRDALASATGLTTPKVVTDVGGDLGALVQDYTHLTQGAHKNGGVPGQYLSRYVDAVQQNGGVVPGEIFAKLTSDMARDARTTGDTTVKNIVNEMRQAMFKGMEVSAKGTPHEGMWRQMNREYVNLLALQKGMSNPTEASALAGTISPQRLYAGIGGKNFARGRSDYDELAHSGLAVMKSPQSSGTSERSYFLNTIPRIFGGAAAGAYEGSGDPTHAIFGGLAAGFGPQLAGRAIMSKGGQRYLSNQVLPRTLAAPYAAPLAREMEH